MDSNTYKEQSAKTLSEVFCLTTKKDFTLLHGAIGIATELGEISEALQNKEIDVVNLKEELGDVLWYIAIFERLLGVDYNMEPVPMDDELNANIIATPIASLVQSMVICSAEILDVIKKSAFYGKPLNDDDFDIPLTALFLNLENITVYHLNSTVSELRTININKLKTRFAEKFSTEAALNRDLAAERSTLETSSEA